jgi:hypothetical protein
VQDFLRLLFTLAGFIPCPLCGDIHEPQIHALLKRKYRDTTTTTNQVILIPVVRCPSAKAKGLAYTKRILPPFLHPFCVIRLDCAMDHLRQYPEGHVGCAEACSMLGAGDPRTARRHLRLTLEGIKTAALQVSTILSDHPSYASLGKHRSGQTPMEVLEEAGEQLQRAAGRLKGGGIGAIPVQLYVYAVGVAGRAKKRLAISLTLVLRIWLFHDTS